MSSANKKCHPWKLEWFNQTGCIDMPCHMVYRNKRQLVCPSKSLSCRNTNHQRSNPQNGHGLHLHPSRIMRGRGTKPPDRIRASQYSEPVLRFHGTHHHGKPSRSCAVPTPFPRAFHVSCHLFQCGFVIPRGTAILPGRTRRGLPGGRYGPRRE